MSDLDKAKTYWSEGEPIPMDLAVSLMAEGYDVEALEDQYLHSTIDSDSE